MKYIKKPVEIEAIRFNGCNVPEVEAFIGKELKVRIVSDAAYEAGIGAPLFEIDIETLEGIMTAQPCDYIIKGIKGEFYPCKPDIFKQTYSCVEPQDEISQVKALRRDLDTQLQKIKSLKSSRETSLAITKIQECIMWLGMRLKAIGEANPYPESYNPENSVIHPTADNLKL